MNIWRRWQLRVPLAPSPIAVDFSPPPSCTRVWIWLIDNWQIAKILTDNWQIAENLTDSWQTAEILIDKWHLYPLIQTLVLLLR